MSRVVFMALLLLAAPATAGTITIQYKNDAGTTVGTLSKTVNDAGMARIETAYGATLIANGNPSPTTAQELTAMVNQWIAATQNFVQGYEQATATPAPPAVVPVQ